MRFFTRDALSRRTTLLALAVVTAGVFTAVGVRRVVASDHQDTPEVELSPKLDVNDVYAFPGSTPDRVVLAMTVSSPITPAAALSTGFGTDVLYQIKIDNNGDAREDLVFQATFTGTGPTQVMTLRGPVAPIFKGPVSRFITTGPTITGPTNTVLARSTPSGPVLGFGGIRDDPFFLDLEQFFRIIPDRRPVSGPLSTIPSTPTASAFRGTPSPPFTGEAPVDYLAGFNALAIVVELPKSMLGGAGSSGKIGVWGTTSLPSN
jgi:hypothetical protein